MNRTMLAALFALVLLGYAGAAGAAPGKDSPSDADQGGGNDPPRSSGQKAQPGPEGNSGP